MIKGDGNSHDAGGSRGRDRGGQPRGAGNTPPGQAGLPGRKRSLRREMKERLRGLTAEQHRMAGAQLVAVGEARGWIPTSEREDNEGPGATADPEEPRHDPASSPEVEMTRPASPHRTNLARGTSVHSIANEHDYPRVFAFASMPQELNTWPLLRAMWAAGLPVYLPRVEAVGLQFYRVDDPGDLSGGTFGIAEPRDGCVAVAPGQSERGAACETNDTILVPGLAFSRSGLRLGRGGGYYDRLLADIPGDTLTLGVCFDFQVVEEVPVDESDKSVGEVHSFNAHGR